VGVRDELVDLSPLRLCEKGMRTYVAKAQRPDLSFSLWLQLRKVGLGEEIIKVTQSNQRRIHACVLDGLQAPGAGVVGRVSLHVFVVFKFQDAKKEGEGAVQAVAGNIPSAAQVFRRHRPLNHSYQSRPTGEKFLHMPCLRSGFSPVAAPGQQGPRPSRSAPRRWRFVRNEDDQA